MVGLKNISAEFKSAALFGSAALVISLLSGFAAGIDVPTVFLRSLLMTLFFLALGYAVVVIIKKFVPEVYQMIKSISGGSQIDVDINDESDTGDLATEQSGKQEEELDVSINTSSADGEAAFKAGATNKKSAENDFSELGDDYYVKMESSPSVTKEEDVFESEFSGQSDQPRASGAKKTKSLGKHIIVQDEFVHYEPKLMAEAVRTMIRKDD